MNIPRKIVSRTQLEKQLKSPDDLECVTIPMGQIIVDAESGGCIVLFEVDGRQLCLPIRSAAECTMLVFMRSGCASNPHLPCVYLLWLSTMRRLGLHLKRVVIEAQHGDVHYARLEWEGEDHTTIFNVCSAGTALIMSEAAHAPVQIVRKVLAGLDGLDTPSNEEIFDM